MLPITAATEPIPPAPEPAPPGPQEPGQPKKRHRRTKAELAAEKLAAVPPAPAVGATPEDLARCKLGFVMLFGLVSKAITKKWGEEMTLTEEEVATLAGAWTEAVAPYLPKMGAQMPLATAAVATFLIALPRWDSYQTYKTAHSLEPV